MPASTSTMLTLAQAKASARLPNSVMSAHTATPTTQALRKQPSRNTATGPTPAASTLKSEHPGAHHRQQDEDDEAAQHARPARRRR